MVDSPQSDAVESRAEGAADTFPKLLLSNRRRFPARHALREKEYGIWQSWTWADLHREVHELACGFAALGFERGDKLAIIGDNRPRLYAAMCAAQALGGVPVPMYQDSVATELQFVLEHSEARFALAEDQEQVDKLLEVMPHCPRLERILYDDARGLRNYPHDVLASCARVRELGREHAVAHPGFLEAEIARGAGSDMAIILYTSGTTGRPKGVVLTHDNVRITAANAVAFDRLSEREEMLAYLPMAWVGDHIFSYGQAYVAGFCVSCPESTDTVLGDLREIGPTYFFAPPRIYENLLTTVTIRMEDAGRPKRLMFEYFMRVAQRCGVRRLEGRGVGWKDRFLYALGELLVYGPLKNTLGFSRIRIAYTAGEAIGPDIFDFYRSLGVNVKQLYGQTEASVFVTMQPDGEIRPDTVGRPAPGVEIRIAESGEVLYRSPGVFHSYFKSPEATAEAKEPDGWVHTGDAGYFDEDGHLRIIDRAKDVGQLGDGSLFAPKYLENKLKFFPQIKEAVTFGDGRGYVAAFINIDLEAVGSWAERRRIPYASYRELAARPEVVDLVQECVEKVNADLAGDPRLAPSQIRRFLVLQKELDADDGELTRTRKVRRSFVHERYRALVDALYSEGDSIEAETQVTYEDGRTGQMRTTLALRDARVLEPLAKAG